MFIRTERLFLRPVFPEDWPAVHRAIADHAIVQMLAGAPWPYTETDARTFCERPRDSRWPRFAITLPAAEGALVGVIGIDRGRDGAPDRVQDAAELGYWIGRDWQRRGFAAEALGGVIEVAAMLGVPRLLAGHFLDNPASGKVLRRCGFVETGEVRPTPCAGRGGEAVLARRYVRDLATMAGARAAGADLSA